MYVRSPKNKQDKKFSVRYDRINNIKYYTNPELDIYEGGLKYIIDHPIWSKEISMIFWSLLVVHITFQIKIVI